MLSPARIALNVKESKFDKEWILLPMLVTSFSDIMMTGQTWFASD